MLRFTPPDRVGLPPFRRRRGLRWRLSVFLIVATVVPVIVVAVAAAALVFSSVEQGIEFEAQRGLQVARALLLGEVHERAKAAAALGNEGALLSALARTPREVRLRLAELSERQPSALLEVTDAVGRVLAQAARAGRATTPSSASASPPSIPPIARRWCAGRWSSRAHHQHRARLATGWWCARRFRWSIRRCACWVRPWSRPPSMVRWPTA